MRPKRSIFQPGQQDQCEMGWCAVFQSTGLTFHTLVSSTSLNLKPTAPHCRLLNLVRVQVRSFRKQGHHYDLKIKQEGPVINVIEVIFDALLHFFKYVGRSPVSVHLCPTCNSRLDVMTAGERSDYLTEESIMSCCMGTGTDKGHFAAQDIYELR